MGSNPEEVTVFKTKKKSTARLPSKGIKAADPMS
jgi:hypothetical protein